MTPSEFRRSRILFVAEAVTLAHVARPLSLAERLDPGRYEIVFATDPRFDKLIDTSKFLRYDISSIPSAQFLKALASGSRLYDTRTLASYVAADLDLIARTEPDVIVGDFRPVVIYQRADRLQAVHRNR
jgi:Glycosyl transferases, related to UDP-glucuronosyltransferase